MQSRLINTIPSSESRYPLAGLVMSLLSTGLLGGCAASTAPREMGPEDVALATYRVASNMDRDAYFALAEHMGEERDAIEPRWRKDRREDDARFESEVREITQLLYEEAVAGVAVDPRLRRQLGELVKVIMKRRRIADCQTAGITPLDPADSGNLRVSVSVECRHPKWTADENPDNPSLSATERMARIVASVKQGLEGPKTGIGTTALQLEQHVREGRREWVVDQGRETNEALAAMIRGDLHAFGVPKSEALEILRAESIRVFESTPWERIPANGLGPQRVAILAVNASNSVEKEAFLAYWTAAGKSKAEIERKLWPAAEAKRRGLAPQMNWVEAPGGRQWPIFEASLKALESAVCEAMDVEFMTSDVPQRRRVASVQLRCEVPTLRYLPGEGWSVNSGQMVSAETSAPVYVNYENVNGTKRWVAGEHSVAWTTTALFKAIYLPAAGVPVDFYIGDDPCTELLSIHGGNRDSAECR